MVLHGLFGRQSVALNERQKIAQGLADADKAAKEVDVAQAKIEEQVREAKEEAIAFRAGS